MIGNKIKELRKQHSMTQKELAKKLKVEQPHLNRWENGARNPSLETIKKISKVFNISIDALVFDEKDIKHLQIKDKNILSQLKGFSNLDDDDKQTILNMINSLSKKK